MDGRRRSTGEPGTGVVVADGLDDAGHHGAQHADHTRRRDGGQAPLDCGESRTETSAAPAHRLAAQTNRNCWDRGMVWVGKGF